MKKEILYIILILIFIGILVLADITLKQQDSNIKPENNVSSLKEVNVMEKVTNENFEEAVLKSEKPVLIDFYADWCAPCKMLSPIVEQVAQENEKIKVVKINVDELQEIATKYGVISIPTLVVIKNGQEINRSVGLISKEEILNLVNL